MAGGILTGRTSVFNHGAGEAGPGPADSGNSGSASGLPFTVPFISVSVLDNPSSTLGGYWLYKAQNGKAAILRQGDVGPAAFTGRTFDVNYAATQLLGLDYNNATDNGNASGVYLGKSAPSAQAVANAASQLGLKGASQIVNWNGSALSAAAGPSAASQLAAPAVSAANAIGSAVSAPFNAAAGILAFFTSTSNWLRIGEAIAGVILIAMGLRSLTGSSSSGSGLVGTVAATVMK